jgi:hypothetical protein
MDTALASNRIVKNRMTVPATRKNPVLLPAEKPSDAALPRQPGWDPFEVWRTRVLLPRLAESGEKEKPATTPVQLVRR